MHRHKAAGLARTGQAASGAVAQRGLGQAQRHPLQPRDMLLPQGGAARERGRKHVLADLLRPRHIAAPVRTPAYQRGAAVRVARGKIDGQCLPYRLRPSHGDQIGTTFGLAGSMTDFTTVSSRVGASAFVRLRQRAASSSAGSGSRQSGRSQSCHP